MMALSEYLDTSYRPDCEYLNGEILQRNVGEFDHSRLLGLLGCYLASREKQWGILVLATLRVQVNATCIRVPDISVLLGSTASAPILQEPAFLCIEIVSRLDGMVEMQERIDDYLAFGVRHVWLVYERTRRAFIYDQEGMREIKDGVLTTQNPDIRVVLSELD